MSFLDENYLLQNNTSKMLYNSIKDLPILDAHNHGDVKEILEDKGWDDIWQVEGATDHYVWELMRKRGVPEEKITGNASNKEKWMALAEVFPGFAGNPTYEWIHLDLKRRFKIEDTISKYTAEKIWQDTSLLLKSESMKPQRLLKEMNVEIMCTTNDPTEDLSFHEKAKDIEGIKVLPTWRPDKAMNIEKENWKDFVEKLGEITKENVEHFEGFLNALYKTHEKFNELGGVSSDHGIFEPISSPVERERVKEVYEKAFSKKELTKQEISDFKSFMFYEFGTMNAESNWVMQLHIGAIRDYRDKLYNTLGPDTGGDISTSKIDLANGLRYFLNQFDEKLKVVLYCLDPSLFPTVATIARAFPNVSLGAPWWFNDSPFGMEMYLKYIATVDLLSDLAGWVTDSRKLISYGSRTEMFRRELSNVVGEMVEKGQIPIREAFDLVKDISYFRPKRLFFKKI
ncbi:MAG: glucuronate isomerase [Petrotoga sp.]|nr:glucuronate isomerase [Petrotoga sp.]